MKYNINKSNYHTFEIFKDHKEDGRSFFIPYPDRASMEGVSTLDFRYQSKKVVCLNGTWDFLFYPRPKDLPDVLDTDAVEFGKMDVPACWQFRGIDRPFYINVRYQFPYHPPVIPTTEKVGKVFSWTGVDQGISLQYRTPEEEYNFVGVYRRNFEIEDTAKKHIISFLGVASCLDFYVNGAYVGYSEGTHNICEFDISSYIKEGENELLAVVHRWCNGTYLESQDMFRNNGIFRDVLLFACEEDDIFDIDARTKREGDTYSLTLATRLFGEGEVTFSIEGNGIYEIKTVQSKNGKASVVFDRLSVSEWNAEEPILYDVYYETKSSCVRQRIGFKTVEIKGDVFFVNGKKIKFHGVNHHETSPDNGYTMTPKEIEKDVLLCKEYNIDTIRTSHYPPDPLLLDLANEYGIYIVDENDLETHGTFAHQLPPSYNSITDDTRWQGHYMDRIARLYERDKVYANTCIVMWSLGNEAGGYKNTDAMYDYLKARSEIPVHYESCIHSRREAYDVGSEMYPSVLMVHNVGEHQRKQKRLNDRPYFLCEYAHAMGVGPGNTESYWQEIYQYDNLMGGCVWEMVDHGVREKDGSFTYGGDHGEWAHDGNFCVDGIFYPDRRPSVGAKIIRFIYRPIRIRHISENQFEIFNTTGFSKGGRYLLKLSWNDGSETEYVPDVLPLEKKTVELPLGKIIDGNRSVLVTAVDKKTGKVVSEEDVVIESHIPAAPAEKMPLPAEFHYQDGKISVELDGKTVFASADPYTILYRAATDNDTNPLYQDVMKPYYAQTESVRKIETIENGIRIESTVSNKKAKFLVTDTYEGVDGGVLVTSHIHCISGRGTLPRFGKTYRLEESFDDVTYVGRSGESYCDMKEQFAIREVSCKVSDMTEPNIRPQESGNRCDVTFAKVGDGKRDVIFEAVEKPYELGIKPYTDAALVAMRHTTDEKRTGTYVTIQAFQQGIGTGACGPGVAKEFLYPAKSDCEVKYIIRWR